MALALAPWCTPYNLTMPSWLRSLLTACCCCFATLPAQALQYEPFLAGGASTAAPASGALGGGTEEDGFHLYYTSGTTGRPKGVLLSHRVVVHHAVGTIKGESEGAQGAGMHRVCRDGLSPEEQPSERHVGSKEQQAGMGRLQQLLCDAERRQRSLQGRLAGGGGRGGGWSRAPPRHRPTTGPPQLPHLRRRAAHGLLLSPASAQTHTHSNRLPPPPPPPPPC